MLRLTCLYRIVRRTLCIASEDMVKQLKFFYAVKKGLKPGVYTTWDDCKSQVDKFPCASYKKFASEKDAWSFVRGVNQSATPKVINDTPSSEAPVGLLPKRGPEALEYIPLGQKRDYSDVESASSVKRVKQSEESSQASLSSSVSTDGFTYMGDAVVVYTDGCCAGNGKKGARAGIGVYWGLNHPFNVADRLEGRQTNQRAELQAACKALQQAKEKNIKKLVLYTDSKFTINGVTSWVKTWKTNGWRLKSGGPIINKDDFEKLDELNAELDVVWIHIPGHAGYTGNEAADKLSRDGAAKPCIQTPSSGAPVGLLPEREPEVLEQIPLGQKRNYSDMESASSVKRVKKSASSVKRVKQSEESSQASLSSSVSTDGFTYMGDAVVVYTDGCCSYNGKKGARAGIGVYWGRKHPLNIADRLQGRQTNQRAELQAACKALQQAKEKNIKKLVLYTDSKFTIDGVTSWVKTWKTNGWTLKSGGPVINKDDFEKLDKLNADLNVVWMHIPGHAGYTGNEAADKLSRDGAAKPYIRDEYPSDCESD